MIVKQIIRLHNARTKI